MMEIILCCGGLCSRGEVVGEFDAENFLQDLRDGTDFWSCGFLCGCY